ncbi:MAG TPA: MotA/TolQ/ExbB proton channel family protein [Candidatus Ozemobacteraceae bacterium]
MIRIVSWVLSMAAFLVVLRISDEIHVFVDLPSALTSWVFPALLLLAVHSPGRVWRALGDLRAPAEAGIAAARFREDAEVFASFGILSLAAGMIGSLAGLITLLSNLANPRESGIYLSISMLTVLYALIVVIFVALPGWRLHSEAAKLAATFEDPVEEG